MPTQQFPRFWPVVLAICFPIILTAQNIIYVDQNAPLGGDGNDWNKAFRYLQDGLLSAAASPTSDEIWVAEGTYYPDDDEAGNVVSGDINASFTLLNDVAVLGGFKMGHTSVTERDWIVNKTTLCGDINQNGGARAYHVIKNDYSGGVALTNSAVLSGFVISDGRGEDSVNPGSDENYGGGMFNNNSSPTISYCHFTKNRASFGAAMYNYNSSPEIENSLFTENIAWEIGDGVFNERNAESVFINCTFTLNRSPTMGSFSDTCIYNLDSDITMVNCILWNNNTEEIIDDMSSSQISYCIVQGGFIGGTNIINSDPLFIDPSTDFEVSICSPAINAATQAISLGSKDFATKDRILFGDLDIGAFEFEGGVIYVDKDAMGMDNGTSWINAYDNLQDALHKLSNCGSPAQVWVAEGTYYADEGLGAVNNLRTSAFKMLPHVELYGGFVGNESELTQRNYEAHLTQLSGDLLKNDLSGGNKLDNAYHVVHSEYTVTNPLTNSARLDGFIIIGGNANQKFPIENSKGGGMLNIYSTPTIMNCSFINNVAFQGGGMYNENSNLELINCTFARDSALNLDPDNCQVNCFQFPTGGGVYHTQGSLTLSSCDFALNYSRGSGNSYGQGGALWTSSETVIDNSTFTSNKVLGSGGAILALDTTTITNCLFDGNESRIGGAIHTIAGMAITNSRFESNIVNPLSTTSTFNHGGAIAIADKTSYIDSTVFYNNETFQYGGAIAILSGGEVNIANSEFLSNTCSNDPGSISFVIPSGAALYVDDASMATVLNTSFRDNFSVENGGAVFNESDNLELTNCLFWNNTSLVFGHTLFNNAADPVFTNCTFANNNLNYFNEFVWNENAAMPSFYSCILWKDGNFSNTPISIVDMGGSVSTVEFSIVQGGWAGGTSILDVFPEFANVSTGDLTLKACSPAIDMGSNLHNQTPLDLAGNTRLFNAKGLQKARIDMGAYEFNGVYEASCSCLDDLVLTGIISSGIYEAAITITCDGTIEAGANVMLKAPEINLTENFEVADLGVLETEGSGCIEN